MTLQPKYAGRAAIVTGIALILEFGFFMASGFNAGSLSDPSQAISLMQDKEVLLRIATFFGFAGAITRILYVTGLAGKLRASTPNRAVAVLYFGILGTIGHGMVALSFYLGFPSLVAIASSNMAAAVNSWGAFQAVTNGFLGLGNVLLGLTLLIAGSAIVAKDELPRSLGIVGIIGGVMAIVSVIITATPLGAASYVVYMVSILASILFDIWVGRQLLRAHQ